MKKLKVITLLSFLFLQNCDFGCISAEEFGVLTLKNIEVHSNPFGEYGLRTGVTAVCKPGCETSGSGSGCSTYNYWTSLNENFNSDYDYQVKVLDLVSFCSIVDIDTSTITSPPLSFELSSAIRNINSANEVEGYNINQYLSVWNDLTSNDVDAEQDNILPQLDCVGKTATIYNQTSGGSSQTLGAGSHSSLNGALSENVQRAVVQAGCLLELYDQTSYGGFNLSLYEGDHNLMNSSFITGGCSANSIFYVGSTAYEVAAYSSDSCLVSFYPIGGGNYNLNDKVTEIYVAPGCKMKIYKHCRNTSSQYGTITGGGTMSSGWWDMSAYSIHTADNHTWQKQVSSAKLLNDPNAISAFTNTNNMTPTIRDEIFGINEGLEFDGTNDFLFFNDAVNFFKSNHTILIVVKEAKGTIYSTSEHSLDLGERLFISSTGSLKYQRGSGSAVTLSSAAIPSISLITIIRNGSNITARVNGQEVYDGSIGHFNSAITLANIGQYWEDRYYPTDFLDGYIGTIKGYGGILADQDLRDVEKELMVHWKVIDCGFATHLDKVRLRIGTYEDQVQVFDGVGNFFIPDSYQDKTGNMMIRLADPEVEGNGCVFIDDNMEYYSDNLGSLDFNFKIVKDSSFVGNLYEFFILPIERYITGEGTSGNPGIEEVFFKGVVGEGSLIQNLVTIALVLFVCFTAFSYLMGVTRYSNWDLIVRVIKIGFVLTLVSDDSWAFFSEYVIGFFRGGALDMVSNISLLVNSDTGVLSGTEENSVANMFTNLDNIFAMFISSQVNAKIWGLLFFPPFLGFLMILMFYYAFYIYVHVIAKVLILYVAIFIMMTFAFIVAPVFIIFFLFQRTREYFTKWLDLVIGYAVQFIFLAAIVGIFSWIILAFFIDLLNYTVCWKPVLYCCGKDSTVHFTLLEFFRPASFDYRRFSMDVKQHYAPGFWDVTLFVFIVYLFKEFLNFAMELATRIAGGVSTGSLADAIGESLGTDNLYKTAGNMASGGFRAGGLAAGAARAGIGGAVGAAGSALGGLAAAGAGVLGKATGNTKIQNFAKSAAKFSASSAKFAGKNMHKGASFSSNFLTDKGFAKMKRKAKGAVYNNTVGKADRALFGKRGPEEQALINDIKSWVKDGHINAATDGLSKEAAIKKEVRKGLEKKGFKESKIQKILNSKQLNKDIQNSTLQTSQAKEILSNAKADSYADAMQTARKEMRSADGGERFFRDNGVSNAHEYAKKMARAEMDKVKKNIGIVLREEHGVQMRNQGQLSRKFARGVNYLKRESVETRMNNIARMSRRLEKDLENFGKETDTSQMSFLQTGKAMMGDTYDQVKDDAGSLKRSLSRRVEALGLAGSKAKKKTEAEKEKFGLYDDQVKEQKEQKESKQNEVNISSDREVERDAKDDDRKEVENRGNNRVDRDGVGERGYNEPDRESMNNLFGDGDEVKSNERGYNEPDGESMNNLFGDADGDNNNDNRDDQGDGGKEPDRKDLLRRARERNVDNNDE